MNAAAAAPTLALFDLDHTLLEGDSDVLWCEFLIERGVLDGARFAPRLRAIEAGYRAGTVGVLEFCEFFVGTLAGRTPADWLPLRQAFLEHSVRPRLAAAGVAAVAAHRAAGHTLVLTTATSRTLAGLTAQALGFEHLIATECAFDAAGRHTGAVAGTPNMREGKVTRLDQWLAARGQPPLAEQPDSVFYSDSINDLPLLRAVRRPVPVDPDPKLAAEAARLGWPVLRWRS